MELNFEIQNLNEVGMRTIINSYYLADLVRNSGLVYTLDIFGKDDAVLTVEGHEKDLNLYLRKV